MQLSNMVNLIVLRNHLVNLRNDARATTKEDSIKIDAKRIELDSKLIEAVKNANIDDLIAEAESVSTPTVPVKKKITRKKAVVK